MLILSHRGFWTRPEEKNGWRAFERSFEEGFGLETDVRDALGDLVVSHDPPLAGDSPVRLVDFLDLYLSSGARGKQLPLALNVKADGLCDAIDAELRSRDISEAFVFDMSVPDMRSYLARGHAVFTRQSDVETLPAYYAESAGVWVDSFTSEGWFDHKLIGAHLAIGKRVCIVSSELHGRNHRPLWDRLQAQLDGLVADENLMLCTDLPRDAAHFFESRVV
ncbi:hypothetical protein [Nocardioides sp. cx-173]|uniref:hypothetical protein n=1 Tax=Nocardioides sp. cx-173 TaxID=2898796 RepID=UPI001E291B26|nr:hypothetical protein [Nocardioides sp. cx-173]MCD4526931.1 hypothetical protein [Nocardioides sp. cx-173]UGB41281.1 hypothetical protein LQ940_18160 [Nocardioides sp. cx-173]